MDNISYDILSGGHYFMKDTILCYISTFWTDFELEKIIDMVHSYYITDTERIS
jgi:hypothetical protein